MTKVEAQTENRNTPDAATTSGILPYYLAIEPSPTDGRSAFAIAKPVGDEAEVAVSVVLEEKNEYAEIFRFNRFEPVKIAWSQCGRLLAFAQNSTLMMRNPRGTLQLDSLAGDVQWLGFDTAQQLWCLAGARLEMRRGGGVKNAIECVESVAVSEFAAYCRREDIGPCIYLHDGNHERLLARLPESRENAAVKLSLHGSSLVVVLCSAAIRDRMTVRILRFDLRTSRMDTLLEEQISVGFNGGPGIAAITLGTDEVLAAYENGRCTQVWKLAPNASPQAISPRGFEVFDFIADPNGTRLAVIASDTNSSLGAFERQLLVGQRVQSEWRFSAPVAGVYDMPRWRGDGRLEVLCGDKGQWNRCIHEPSEDDGVKNSRGYVATHVSKGAIDFDFVRLPGPEHRRAAIILLPRLHQQFVAGAQSFFFHHLLFTIARSLAGKGYCVVAVGGPGAIGRGRRRREPTGSYFAQLRSALEELTRLLRAGGYHSIGILAGSLAAVPAVRFIGPDTKFSACAFLAPLFEASIPMTRPVRHHLFDDPAIESFENAAVKIDIPLLVIQGACDEVAPVWQASQLYKRVQKRDMVELCILEEEGHIFRKMRSWQRAQMAIQEFFRLHLAVNPSADDVPAS